jgi:surface antigen
MARECVSGAAWWGSQVIGKPWPLDWGNADNWPSAARAAGFTVNSTCLPNSIMCIPPNTNGSGKKGHVAFVTQLVAGGASVLEMNFLIEFGFDFRTASIAHCEYIHLAGPGPHPAPTPQPILEEDDVTILATRSPGSVDPHGAGAVYLVKDAIYGPKRWVTAMAFPTYEAALGAPKIINAFILDRMEEGPHIDAVASPPEA